MNLKRKFIRKNILKLSRENRVAELKKKLNLGFIFEGLSSEEIIEFVDRFKKEGWSEEQMKVLICDPEEAPPRGVETEVLRSSDISVSGIFKEETDLNFLSYHYDFLIGSFSEKTLTASLVFGLASARVKMGRKPDVFNLFDVEISAGEGKVFQEESLKYLEILKVKN